MLLPRALVARGEGTLLLQTRTLRSREEVTGQGLPWVRVELGLEEGVRGGASSGFSEKSHPQRPAGQSWQAEWLVSQCDQTAGSWAPRWADPHGDGGRAQCTRRSSPGGRRAEGEGEGWKQLPRTGWTPRAQMERPPGVTQPGGEVGVHPRPPHSLSCPHGLCSGGHRKWGGMK